MKFETAQSVSLPKIGLGTWSFGGRQSADHRSDVVSLKALKSAIELGYRHFDTAEMYAAGNTEALLGRAVRETGIHREDVIITTKVQPQHLAYAQVLAACQASLDRLGMDYVDLYLIHWPSAQMDLQDTFRALNELAKQDRVRHLGVSNFDIPLLRRAQALSGIPILTNQVPYSLSDRTYLRNGLIEYCQANGIVVTAYSPLGQGRLRPSTALQLAARRHGSSRSQIALAWLCMQPRVIAIPMSRDAGHQRENLEAADIELSSDEMAGLD